MHSHVSAIVGCGYRQHVDLRDGIFLTLHDYTFHDDLLIKNFSAFKVGDFELVFQLSSSHRFDNGYAVSAGQNYLIRRFTNQKFQWMHWAQERVLEVDIHVEPSVFRSFVADWMELRDPALGSIFEETHGRFFQPHTTTPAMQRALMQMLNCRYRGLTRRIYLEGKSLELIALQLEQIIDRSEAPVAIKLCRDDVDRIHDAKDILMRRLDQPPSILELARQVGMSESKLHRGFRRIIAWNRDAFYLRLENCRCKKWHEPLGMPDKATSAMPLSRNLALRPSPAATGISRLVTVARLNRKHLMILGDTIAAHLAPGSILFLLELPFAGQFRDSDLDDPDYP